MLRTNQIAAREATPAAAGSREHGARLDATGDAGDAEADPAAASISAETLAAPIRFLADDLLEGRGPGTRGDALARQYIASTMSLFGLEPGAAGGSFEQPMDLIGVTSEAPRAWRFAGGARSIEFRDRTDFVAVAGPAAESVHVGSAEIVFVGYGIEAPEYGWDDFKGADLRGKVLLMMNDDPDWDPALFAWQAQSRRAGRFLQRVVADSGRTSITASTRRGAPSRRRSRRAFFPIPSP